MSVPPSARLPAGVRRIRLTLPAGAVAALACDPPDRLPGRRLVLCVPGFTGSKEDFAPLLPLLAAGRLAAALDLPGQFESAGPDAPSAYTIAALAGTVRQAARLLAGSAAVHLVGHSFGGLVCRAATLDAPDLVASLTLLGSGPAAIGGRRAAELRRLGPLLDSGGLAAVWEAAGELDPRRRQLPAVLQEFLRRRFFASHPTGLRVMAGELLSATDRSAPLAASGVPLLVAHGEGDDAWPPAVQREMAARLKARYAVLPGALHSPAAEAPQALAAVLTGFLDEVDARPDAG